MKWSKILAAYQQIDDTGLVYLVLPDGQIKPMRVNDYLAMSVRELRDTLALPSRGSAERAALKRRGIEAGQEIQRN